MKANTTIDKNKTEVKKQWFGEADYSTQLKNGVHGSFGASLYKAWEAASNHNRKTLVEAFPEYFPTTKYEYFF
ncbi:MAG TPA: hypothetical protein VIK09_01310 [Candidatus Humimicrobiaceae bacterium]